jgi:hypothetical protein
MRNRPTTSKTPEQEFIENAQADRLEANITKEDLHLYVRKVSWPLGEHSPTPSFAEGSSLKKPVLVYLNEKEWNSIDRHTKTIGVSKQEWLKHAIYKLLEEEQLSFLNMKR